MKQQYIPPHKRDQYKINDLEDTIDVNYIDFPKLTIINTGGGVSRESVWNKKKVFSFGANANGANANGASVDKKQQFFKNQQKTRNRLLQLTLEQSERDKINYQLQEESPFWNEKNLLDPDSDISEEEYDINKDQEIGVINNNIEE